MDEMDMGGVLLVDEYDRVPKRVKKAIAKAVLKNKIPTPTITHPRVRWAIHRGADMPLKCELARESKGVYLAVLYHLKTGREIDWERIHAPNKKEAKAWLKRLYPTIRSFT